MLIRGTLPLLVLLGTADASAAEYADPQGWVIELPAGWKSRAEQGRVLFGHDVEAGLIVAWFAPGATWEQMQQAAAAGVNDGTMSLTPRGKGKEKSLKGGRALFLELTGADLQGTALKARAVGVLGPKGGVAIFGITTPPHYQNLKKRVDSMAASLRFKKGKASGGGAGAALLSGAMCHYSGGNTMSSTQRYTFDGNGNVGYGSEFVAGGQLDDGYGTKTGSWGAYSGNQYNAKEVGAYRVDGNFVTIQFGATVYNCTVHFRQQDGRITELMCNGNLWGAGLCE